MLTTIATNISLPASPTIISKVVDLTQSDTATFDAIIKYIELDAAISATVMHQANSAGFAGAFKTIRDAAISLGEAKIARIVLNHAAKKLLTGLDFIIGADEFTCMCFYSAIAAMEMDGKRNMGIYTASLLRNIGHIALFQNMPEQARLCWSQAKYNKKTLYQAEADIIGFTHADLAAAILENWQLPKSIYMLIQNCFDDKGVLYDAYNLVNFKFSLTNEITCLPENIADIDLEYNLAKDILTH